MQESSLRPNIIRLQDTIERKAWNAPLLIAVCIVAILTPSCGQNAGTGTSATKAAATAATTTNTGTSSTAANNGPQAVQIITTTGAAGSFDSGSVPASGGAYNYAQRFFDLKGSLITSASNWWLKSSNGIGVFLTSTSTSFPGGGSGATTSSSSSRYRTPCAYFDSTDDNNPESSGYFTIDGLVSDAPSLNDITATADVDQCAGITNTEKSKLGLFFTVDRANFLSTDKLQVIVRARPLNAPHTAPTPSTCIVGGLFDATSCANTVFTISMRTAVAAAARPFYMLFPSAKSLDLLSETVLLPTHVDSTITTISIDRIKGGAVFYGVTLVRIP